LSLVITIPLIMKDHRQGQGRFIGIAVSMILIAQLALTFFGFSVVPVFLSLIIYFAGFNFLEAALPARLSILADDEIRGASLGVFSSAQFMGAFIGGLIGGRFLGQPGQNRPADVFFVCALLAGIWLALQSFGRFRKS
jgi:predicted MFS family arabinose efflux permease